MRKTIWQVAGTFFIGVFATGLITWDVERTTKVRIEEALADSHNKAVAAVLERIRLYQYGLHGVRGAVHTVGLANLSRAAFLRYTETRNYNRNFPGARGFGVIRKVLPQETEAFVQQARDDGWPSFSLTELSANASERYIIQYIEPVDRNVKAVGLDIASERNRREAARKALLTGEVQITGPITLVQVSGKHLQSFLILMPIYQSTTLPPVAQREELAFGWSYAPLLMSEVLADIKVDTDTSFLRIQDITESESREYFYVSEPSDEDIIRWQSSTVEVFGRKWKFEFGIKPDFIYQLSPANSMHYLAGGLSLSLLLSTLVYVLALGRRSRQATIDAQAKMASIVENSEDGILGLTANRELISWNHAAKELVANQKPLEPGDEFHNLWEPRYQPFLDQAFSALDKGQRIHTFHIQRERDEKVQWLAITISVIGDTEQGYSVVIRNETTQKEAELTIQNANLLLEKKVASRTTELQSVNQLLQSVLDAASQVVIIVFTAEGIVTLFNRGAEQVLGYNEDETLGSNILALFNDNELNARNVKLAAGVNYCPVGLAALTGPAQTDGIEKFECHLIKANRSTVPVSMVITAIRGTDNVTSGYLLIANDISEQKSIKAALEDTRDRLLMATSVAELGIWNWDVQSDELNWNDRMYEIYDYGTDIKSQGITYQHWRRRVHPDDIEMAESALMDVVLRDLEYNTKFRLISPQGEIKFIKAEARSVKDSDGRVIYVTGINIDVTDQVEVEQSLRRAKENADAASAAKSNFLANMSHEIRTPMNAVIGMLQLINQTSLTDKQQDYLSKAQSASKSLLQLLNDVLDYSKIEAGKIDIDLHPADLESLIRELTVVFSGSQMKNSVELLYDIDTNLPKSVLVDSLRLKQVLINLVSNALKFTMAGTVTVVVKRQSNGEIQFGVKDTGIGITEAQQKKIFQSFSQADPSTARRFGGSGLGLVISRRLTNLMGGELQFTSEEGEGSHFWFSLPLVAVDDANTPSITTAQVLFKRVLVIDDNPYALEILSESLKGFGLEVDQAKTGQEGIAKFEHHSRSHPIDLLLVDLRLPDISGLDVARSVRRSAPSSLQPKIVMVTAHGRDELESELNGEQPSFDCFITKPVTPLQLFELISAGKKDEAVSERSKNSQKAKRLSNVTILLVDDNEINRVVANELLSAEGAKVYCAEGGAECITMLKANKERIQLVLMDMQMPDVDGIEATTRIRKIPEFTSLPIIAMTANVSKDDIQACLDAGMNDHIGKPFDLENVVEKILSVLART
ncbi:PAS domain-containing hybrid sensor histidine kinase/response regulator [Bowmanella denitrificans]|uniref:PAS domain-containing hybrid sensor histidine kinase/response regulator n=1 Tax=Bowmanella denitrificans TaxID=366582 RepID=UPI001559572C|nr:CHASE domain-containing protein [Bowmanella denitrificans]